MCSIKRVVVGTDWAATKAYTVAHGDTLHDVSTYFADGAVIRVRTFRKAIIHLELERVQIANGASCFDTIHDVSTDFAYGANIHVSTFRRRSSSWNLKCAVCVRPTHQGILN